MQQCNISAVLWPTGKYFTWISSPRQDEKIEDLFLPALEPLSKNASQRALVWEKMRKSLVFLGILLKWKNTAGKVPAGIQWQRSPFPRMLQASAADSQVLPNPNPGKQHGAPVPNLVPFQKKEGLVQSAVDVWSILGNMFLCHCIPAGTLPAVFFHLYRMPNWAGLPLFNWVTVLSWVTVLKLGDGS